MSDLDRCVALVDALQRNPALDPSAFDEAVALVTGPLAGHAGGPGRPSPGRLAAALVLVAMRHGQEMGMARLATVRPLLAIADTDPPPGPDWHRARTGSLMLATMVGALDSPDPTVTGHDRLDELETLVGDDQQLAELLRFTKMSAVAKRAMTGDDPGAFYELREFMRTAQPEQAGLFASMSALLDAQRSGDLSAAVRAMDAMRAQTDDPWVRRSIDDVLTMIPLLKDSKAALDDPGHVGGDLDEQLAAVRARLDRPDATDHDRMMLRFATAISTVRDSKSDPTRTDASIDELRSTVAGMPADDPRQVIDLVNLGMVLVRRAEQTNTVTDLPEAARVFEQAGTLAGGPEHPMWELINEGLSWVHRRGGADSGARRAALERLKTYAWRVMVQPDLRSATEAARDAAKEAMDVARWCLRDLEPGDAVPALDLGRGLLLFAATELRDLATRLADAGHADLHERWLAATASGGPEAAPAELRREVLAVLANTEGGRGAGLLDPPSLPEIRAALSTLDADALVYLVSAALPLPGAAVIVPVDGPPAYIPLANLHVEGSEEFERYVEALNTRDIDPEDDGTGGAGSTAELAERVDELCEWAWKAAIGPLLTRYLHDRPKPDHRPHRVFLVPMGDLARVPWQAARHADGTYALQAAAFSQVASARMLCESARRPRVPISSSGLVVGDPYTGVAADLPAARAEGFAIHKAFYRGSRYVGRRPDGRPNRSGSGSREDVLTWLAGPQAAAGSMLHLACHGVIRTDPADTSSYLLLADGDRLRAEELVATMAGHPERAISLVVLAACRSGVSPYGYDEAYSLGTAFLATGVRSVLSTQWAIPDADTSVLAFMVHHFLAVEGREIWDALRSAQLWMLDRDRKPPGTMPKPLLRQLDDSTPEKVVSWAGFVHWGQ